MCLFSFACHADVQVSKVSDNGYVYTSCGLKANVSSARSVVLLSSVIVLAFCILVSQAHNYCMTKLKIMMYNRHTNHVYVSEADINQRAMTKLFKHEVSSFFSKLSCYQTVFFCCCVLPKTLCSHAKQKMYSKLFLPLFSAP